MKSIKIFATAIATAVLFSPALATDSTTGIKASAQLQATCTLAFNDIAFGVINPKVDKILLADLSMTCNSGVQAVGTISAGNSGNVNSRYMVDGTGDSDPLNYSLRFPGFQTEIGDGNNGTVSIQITGTGQPEYQWIAVLVPRKQYVRPGNYSDTLTLTVTY